MTAQRGPAAQYPGSTENPVEMLVIGCPVGVADGFANALRNQGQAAHLKTADSPLSLEQHLSDTPCDLLVINADSKALPLIATIEQVRAARPQASIVLVGKDPVEHRSTVIEHGLQDSIDISDVEHLAFALRREHHTRMLQQEVAGLRDQLEEAEKRCNLLVQSSRDAIAYIHEGMYLNVNRAYLEMFGYESADELDGLPIMDMIAAESRGSFKTALRRVMESGRHEEAFHCVTGDGETFCAHMEFSPASIDGEACTQVMIRDQRQNLALQQRIEELTNRDTQTGLFNRQSFMERLEGLIGTPEGVDTRYALVQISITNYPEMREACGFTQAEQMLTEVAAVLAETAEHAHTLARFGDHDFMILCDRQSPALDVAERCLRRLRTHAFRGAAGDPPLKPIYAIGVTHSDQGAQISAHELINRSCRATGIARAKGENRVVCYEDEIPGDTQNLPEADAAVIRLIDSALANDGFRLKYQPIVSLQGDTRENYSVYLRLDDQEGGELEPAAFLSPARDAGRLAEIDRWVVRNAIRELAGHRRDGRKVGFYLILSRSGIEDDSMLLWICDCLREFRAKGSWLVFQFRETDLRGAFKPAKELIAGLKKINCRIALSNYSDSETADVLLRHLDIDIVKLSPELMRGLACDAAQQDHMAQTNQKLQDAGYRTIASSVEDAGSLAVLWNIGVNYIQGHFLQEPSPTIAFETEQETHYR